MLNAKTFTEKELPNNHRVIVSHLHSGNSSNKARHGKPYVTIAKIFTKDGTLLGEGKAECTKNDVPNRSIGRAIAVGRAMKQAYTLRVTQTKAA